ncbi:hypothetical protein CLOHYLEM_03992 [[Clostridium] hylemonae DSM 15053]|uniref:Uncharacterized protein n=1 Tax=[Clostridium] hylemonae DSM 15053 TaxID=553973 RepID=C0BVZ4_9FIRM|nr:hypothetical protein CLOHYLEM_03992 [[Clostridium] hylemonae DSM 15053]
MKFRPRGIIILASGHMTTGFGKIITASKIKRHSLSLFIIREER